MILRTLMLLAAAALTCPAAHTQEFPSRAVKIIVPYAPGGASDVVARVIGPPMAETFGQQFIVENRPGAGGIPGFEALVKSPADGHTLIIGDAGQWAMNPALYAKLPYDPLRDLAPVGVATTLSLFLVVHESVPAKSLEEIISLVKSKPGFFNYGSSGTGTVHHLTMEAFKAAFGLDIVHVPYKGTGQSTPALLSGQVSMTIAALTSIAPHVKSGKVRVLAANTKKRSPFAPDVPSIAEFGVADFDFPGDLALLAPAGTPRSHIDKLAEAMAQALRRPEVVQRLASLGMQPVGGKPEELAAKIREEMQRYARVVKAAGAKVE